MPGIAYHFKVLEKTIATLAAGSAADKAKAQIMQDNSAFAHLGALGPTLLEFVPVDPDTLDLIETTEDPTSLPLDQQLSLSRNTVMIAYGSLFRKVLDAWALLDELNAFLAQMTQIANDEDLDALKEQQDAADALQSKIAALSNLTGDADALKAQIETLIASSIPLMQMQAAGMALQQLWRLFEYLRWRRPGRFARKLVELAEGSGDDTLMAFAYGWLAHVAGAVTGEPFINDIVGGPYRTHWWRNRYVRNYVDSWTWGYDETGASLIGNEPTPAYDTWENLPCAKLHTRIALPGGPTGPEAAKALLSGDLPQILPGALLELLDKALNETYTGARPVDLTADAFQRAYVGATAVLWFTTSGEGAICPTPPGAPPSTCTTPPDWVTTGSQPPSPAPDVGVSGSATATAVVLAILAILAFLSGLWPLGLAAIGGAIAAAVAGIDVDWAALRCDLYWYRFTVFQGMNALRSLLVTSGLAYPINWELGTVDANGNTTPALDSSGRPLTQAFGSTVGGTTVPTPSYPRTMDTSLGTPGINYLFYPTSAPEQPTTVAWLQQTAQYPNAPLSDLPLSGGGMLTDDGAFPTRDAFFGGSVPNAVQLIQASGVGLVDYNLDGDRGYGWKPWKTPPAGGTVLSGNVNAQPEP